MMPPDVVTRVRRRKQEHAQAVEAYRRESAALAAAFDRRGHLEVGLDITRGVAVAVQEEAHRKITHIVTEALQTVFGGDVEFRILFEQKRGRTEARLVFIKDGAEMDPLTSSGGGMIDVAAFALRLSCLLISRPPVRKAILLDEPFKHLSADYRPKMAAVLRVLSEQLGVQIIMVSHADELKTGKIIRVGAD